VASRGLGEVAYPEGVGSQAVVAEACLGILVAARIRPGAEEGVPGYTLAAETWVADPDGSVVVVEARRPEGRCSSSPVQQVVARRRYRGALLFRPPC
jgi:hypothetical protein